MWKLKVAEGHGPWLYSLNNFVGRQIWEFDPEAGTPEEREEVRKVQENFTKNRFRYKPNGDLLMRMQVCALLFMMTSLDKFFSSSIFQHGILLMRLIK